MTLVRLTLHISFILALLGVALGIIGTGLVGVSIYLSLSRPGPAGALAQEPECPAEADCNPVAYDRHPEQGGAVPPTSGRPYLTPTSESLLNNQAIPPAIIQRDLPAARITPTVTATFAAVNRAEDTLTIQSDELYKPIGDAPPETPLSQSPASIRTPTPEGEETQRFSDSFKRSTPSSTPPSEEEAPQIRDILEPAKLHTPTPQVEILPSEEEEQIVLEPITTSGCPAGSNTSFDLIPIEGQPLRDHPADVHGDLNLALRGYILAGEAPGLISYEGATDADAPQLAGLFEPNRQSQIQGVYRVNDWIWDSAQCGGHPRGCPGPPAATFWPVTLVGLAATPGEAIYPPERGAQIYSGGYTAIVLYAEAQRITLGYTRRNSVATGYVVHLEDICVNPNLVALYRAQLDAEGWNDSGRLPGLRNNQALGQALGSEIKVAVRDAGSFMDPRSQKDWWR